MSLRLFHIVLIRGKGISQFFVNSQHIGQLEETACVMNRAGFAHTHKTAALMDPSADRGHQLPIQPLIPAGPGRSRIACIDDHIHILRDALLPDVVKADKDHIHTGAA